MTYLDVEADLTLDAVKPAIRRALWWSFGRWVALGLAAMVVSCGIFWSLAGLSQPFIVLSLLTAAVAIQLGVLLSSPRGRRARTLFDGRFRYVASDEGLLVEAPYGQQMLKWSVYRKACVDKDFLYLFVSPIAARCIPLALIPDARPLLDYLTKIRLLKPAPKSFFFA